MAFEILREVEGGSYADALVGSRLEKSRLSDRDRGLTTKLVYGCLTWQKQLDYFIHHSAARDPSEFDRATRCLLRLATFQIVHLDRVPKFAAVNTAVELAKTYVPRAKGLINAVLRRVSNKWQAIELPSETSDLIDRFSIEYSHPEWLVERWISEFGEAESRMLMAANNQSAPTTVRVNRLRESA